MRRRARSSTDLIPRTRGTGEAWGRCVARRDFAAPRVAPRLRDKETGNRVFRRGLGPRENETMRMTKVLLGVSSFVVLLGAADAKAACSMATDLKAATVEATQA